MRRAVDSGVVLAIVVGLVYVWGVSPYLVGNDNAEFSTLGSVGGIAHPSGYPGYILWLRALSWLPGESAAHVAGIATALLAALSIYVLHAGARAWGASPIAATLAAGIYAASPHVLRYSTEAEAFAPNQLVVATVLWLAAANGPLRGGKRALALGLVAGLGMTNHMTCTLIAPVGLLGIYRASRETSSRVVPIAIAAGGWVLGMTPYLYLFVAPQNLLGWPNPGSLGEALDIVLRRAYGGAFGFSGTGDPVPYLSHLGELARSVGRAWLWVLAPLGLVAIGQRIARPAAEHEPRSGWIALAISLLLAGPILAAKFDVPTVEFGLHIIHRFHLLPTLLLVIPVAVGVTWLATLASRVAISRTVLHVLAHLAFVVALALSLPDVGRYRTAAMEQMARNTLRSMPPNAVIMAGYVDELDVGIRYLQLTRGERPDVLFFRWRDAAVDWYRERLVPYGLVLPPGTPYAASTAIDVFHRANRPVFVYWREPELRAAYPSYPFGVLARILPRGTKPPSLAEVFAENRALFESFDFSYPIPGKHDEFATWVQRKYVGAWARLSRDLAAAGMTAEAAHAHELAEALNPRD